jgi:hypothetical protein
MSNPPKLRLIHGGQRPTITLGSFQIYLVSESIDPSFDIDVQVVEEDTWQVLSADTTAREIDEHPIRLMTELIEQKPLAVGDVHISGPRWRVVIVDFDQEPVCQPAWLRLSLKHLFERVEEQDIRSLSMPLLGIQHGHIPVNDSLALLLDTISPLQLEVDCRIWLTVPQDSLAVARKKLLSVID